MCVLPFLIIISLCVIAIVSTRIYNRRSERDEDERSKAYQESISALVERNRDLKKPEPKKDVNPPRTRGAQGPQEVNMTRSTVGPQGTSGPQGASGSTGYKGSTGARSNHYNGTASTSSYYLYE